MPMRIRLSELREASELLISHLEEVCGDWVDLDLDYYWDVGMDARYVMTGSPQQLEAGQLSDDWREMHDLVSSDTGPLIFDLVSLAAILRAIGEESGRPGSGIGPG